MTSYLFQVYQKLFTKASDVPGVFAAGDRRCKWRLDNDSSAIHILPDGRKMGYAQYGALGGRAILYMHGHPAARIEATYLDDIGIKLNARIIAPDRPGFGWSSPQANRTILDHTTDVMSLTEHLGLNEYSVLGVSGGGPYALACAYALPAEKLKSVAIVGGMGLPDMPKTGMRWWNWIGFTYGYRYFPGLTRQMYKREIGARLELSDEERLEGYRQGLLKEYPSAHPKDKAIFSHPEYFVVTSRTHREVFAQGIDATIQDGQLYCKDFGFRIEDIRKDLPVELWYGKFDVNCPPVYGEQTAARLRGKSHLRVDDETHWTVYMNHREEIVQALLESADADV